MSEETAAPKTEELVGEIQDPIEELEAKLKVAKAEKEELESRLNAKIATMAKFGKQESTTKDDLTVGHFTSILVALNGRHCPKVVRDLLSRCGEWIDRIPEYASNCYQNAIDHAKRADIYNRKA